MAVIAKESAPTFLVALDEHARAWNIVRAYGQSSLARFALLDDKQFFFNAGGSLISYVVKNRVALVLGDPIGPAEDACACIVEFRQYCTARFLLPAFYQVSPSLLDGYTSLGFDSLLIGREAIVEVCQFTLEGSSNKTLRNSYNKLLRQGYYCEVLMPPHSAHMMRELKEISNDWLVRRGATEFRFLGWFDEAYLNSCCILIARDREGFLEAFLNLVPEFQANEVAVDLMRQRRQTESGLMDFLFVSLFCWAKENHYSTINVGLSALSGVGECATDPIIERALNRFYWKTNFSNFRGLFLFKQKFHPAWSPRYLIFPGIFSLPLAGLALFRALYPNFVSTFFRRFFRRLRKQGSGINKPRL